MIIRKITADELAQSAQIVFDAFNQLSEQTGVPATPDVQTVVTRLEEYMADSGIPSVMYGGFEDDVQVGFFILRKLGIDEETWEISMLSVAPSQQHSGRGVELLRFAIDEILKLKGVLVVCAVTEGNNHVLEMFAREGFECEASGIPIGDGELRIWMLRRDMKNASAAIPACPAEGCEGCSAAQMQ